MKVHIIGVGEVGTAMSELARGIHEVCCEDIALPAKSRKPDIMQICYPYTDKFFGVTSAYMEAYKPKLTIIESTVKPGTTHELHKLTKMPICHSPVRGRMAIEAKWGILNYTKYVGPAEPQYAKPCQEYYESLGIRKVRICRSPLDTEYGKLLDTTYYGLMIAWFQEVARLCRDKQISFPSVCNFYRTDTEESGYKHMRPVMYPGVIGGHCVMPNTELLKEVFDSPFLDAIIESNEKSITESKIQNELDYQSVKRRVKKDELDT